MAVDAEARANLVALLAEFATRWDGGTWGIPANYSVLVRQDQPVGSGSSQFKGEDVPMAADSVLVRVGANDISGSTIGSLVEITLPVADDLLLVQENTTGTLKHINVDTLSLSAHTHGLNNLTDVAIAAVADKHMLQYSSVAGEWQNKTIDNCGLVDKGSIQTITGQKTFSSLIATQDFEMQLGTVTAIFDDVSGYCQFTSDTKLWIQETSGTGIFLLDSYRATGDSNVQIFNTHGTHKANLVVEQNISLTGTLTGMTNVIGTGNIVLAAAPTLTGTTNVAALVASGAITANGGIAADSISAVGTETTFPDPVVMDQTLDVGGSFSCSAVVDTSSNELVKFSSVASAVNEITVTNAIATNDPSITATGDDTNISLVLAGKGTGGVQITGVTASRILIHTATKVASTGWDLADDDILNYTGDAATVQSEGVASAASLSVGCDPAIGAAVLTLGQTGGAGSVSTTINTALTVSGGLTASSGLITTSIEAATTTVNFIDDVVMEGSVDFQGRSTGAVFSGARVYHSVTGSGSTNNPATGTWTNVEFDTESYDTENYHSTISNTDRLTVPTAGRYQVMFHVRHGANTTGKRGIRFRVNNVGQYARVMHDALGGNFDEHMSSVILDLAANDYVTVQVWQNSGGNLAIQRIANFSPIFSIQRMDNA